VFGYPDRAVLVRLIASKLLINPRMRVSAEPQATLRFPLFDCTNQALDAVLASIHKVFLVLYDLADLADEGEVMADHGIKAFVGMDAMRPAVMQQNHFVWQE
jgi:hypothetical protein